MLKKQEAGNGNSEDEINQPNGEVSEDENDDNSNADASSGNLDSQLEELYRLREEEDTLRCQVEALKNELTEMQATHEEDMERRDRIFSELLTIKQAVDESNKALLILSQKRSKENEEADPKNCPVLKRKRESDNDGKGFSQGTAASTSSTVPMIFSPQQEARLISLISIFLHVLPFGANADYICSYLHQMGSDVKTLDVENVLKRYPTIFKKNSNGIGGSLSENWRFVSF